MNANYKKRLTNELIDAIDTVCAVCPYISHEVDAGEKYCERCMVRLMVNLYDAMDNTEGELSYSSPEWRAIINY